jgi:hypothetical protein
MVRGRPRPYIRAEICDMAEVIASPRRVEPEKAPGQQEEHHADRA